MEHTLDVFIGVLVVTKILVVSHVNQTQLGRYYELIRKLDREQARLEELAAPHDVPTDVLFPSEFMAEHTKFNSFDDMLEMLATKPAVFDDLDAIEEWDRLVADTTDFETWDDMKETAGELYGGRRLGLG